VDLNSATHTAQCGAHIRDDANMREGWTVRWVAEEKLLYYFRPSGERAHKLIINDAHRASFQWRTIP
jgi:hypothetical protein